MELLQFALEEIKLENKDDPTTLDEDIVKFQKAIEDKSQYNLHDTLMRLTWTKEYFNELDTLLTNIGFVGNSADIATVRKHIQDKVKSVGILQFNEFLHSINHVQIDNHIKWIEDNINNIPNIKYMSKNPAAIELLYKYQEKIDWVCLSCNPAAMAILLANPDQINWLFLSENPAAIELLRANLDKVEWMELSANPAAIEILIAYLDKIHWDEVSANPAAMPLIEANLDKVDWDMLCLNPAAIKLIKANMNKVQINWRMLSRNPNASKLFRNNIDWRGVSANSNDLQFLLDNFDKLKFHELSYNPVAVSIIANHLDKVGKYGLSKNPASIEILKNNKHLIDWNGLIVNKYDYEKEKITAFNAANLFSKSHLQL